MRPTPSLAVVSLALICVVPVDPASGATFVVDKLTDAHDSVAGDGTCGSGAGTCSFRAAIEEANALVGSDTVSLPAGTHVVSLVNSVPAGLPIGVQSEMEIVGSGVGVTTIYADAVEFIGSAILDVAGDLMPGGVTIADLTMDIRTGGLALLVSSVCGTPLCTVTTVEDVELLGTTAPGGIFGTSPLFEVSGTNAHLLLRRVTATTSRTPAAFSSSQVISGHLTLEDTILDAGASPPIGVNVGGNGHLVLRRSLIHNLGTGGSAPTLNAGVAANLSSGSGASIELEESELRGGDRGIRVRNFGIPIDLMVAGSLVTGVSLEALLVEGPSTGLVSNSTISDAGTGVALATPTGGAGSVSLTLDRATLTDAGTSVSVAEGSGTLTAFGSIIANGAKECSGTLTSSGYNLIEGDCGPALTGTDITGVDPQLDALADNGGPTRTHALGASSPALDSGTPDASSCGTSDQRDFPRPGDGDGDRTARCDIGAYEKVEVFLRDSFDDGTFLAWDQVVGGPDN